MATEYRRSHTAQHKISGVFITPVANKKKKTGAADVLPEAGEDKGRERRGTEGNRKA